MAQIYNDPINAAPSSIGTQTRTDYFQKKALIELTKEQYFGQLADVTAMPKNMGKTIKRFHYIPLLDDENINDQGLDAAGAVLTAGLWSAVDAAGAIISSGHADAATAYAVAGATTVVQDGGNLYGSSKDIGAISGKLPALTENGGKVNRVGHKRKELQGTIEKFGFYDKWTQESLDFDSDDELEMHIHREMLRGANEMTEDALQIDLINGAGVVKYGGAATSIVTMDADGVEADDCIVTYNGLMRLGIDLDNNRCPKTTKLITGSRMVDTKTIDAARYIYCGSEMIPTLRNMVDNFGNQAFIPVHQYADATQTARGEIGSIDQFRIIVVPEMMNHTGQGADATVNARGYRSTTAYNVAGAAAGERYDVFPMLVVGSGSFTSIGFQTDGKSVKFKIKSSKPGSSESYANDYYGETGFMSIKWYFGTMILRPEWLAVTYSLALA